MFQIGETSISCIIAQICQIAMMGGGISACATVQMNTVAKTIFVSTVKPAYNDHRYQWEHNGFFDNKLLPSTGST